MENVKKRGLEMNKREGEVPVQTLNLLLLRKAHGSLPGRGPSQREKVKVHIKWRRQNRL